MSGGSDLERAVTDWLRADATTARSDQVLTAALVRVSSVRQERRRPPLVADANAVVTLAIAAAVVVIAVVGITLRPDGHELGGSGPEVSAPLTPTASATSAVAPSTGNVWTPEHLAQDWPAPVRSEPSPGAPAIQMTLGDDARWDPARAMWEGFEYVDPVGDVALDDGAWLDLKEVRGGSGDVIAAFLLQLAGPMPQPTADPLVRWIAYGVVLDTDGDGAPDVRIGIDNMPSGQHRAWRIDLATGQVDSKAGPPYGVAGRVGLDTWFPGEPDWAADKVWIRYSRQPGERGARFYAWASMIEGGRVVATDYAPDSGWLEEGPQPELSLVGPVWSAEYVLSGAVVTPVPETVSATLVFTDDGRVTTDTNCGPASASVAIEPGTLRVSDRRLTGVTCLGDAAGLTTAIQAVLSADEIHYTLDAGSPMDVGLLELRAGSDGLRLRATYEGPPPG